MRRIKAVVCIALLLSLTLSLSGCVPRQKASPSRLTIATPELSGCYDPFFTASSYDADIYELMFDGLVKQDTAGAVVPSLADYTVSPDGTVYTFTLKKAAYWNGEPVRPEDFLLALKVYADPSYFGFFDVSLLHIAGLEAYRAGEADSISGVACSGNQLTVQVLEPSSVNLADFAISPLCSAYYADAYTYGDVSGIAAKLREPMATGLFQFEKYTAGQSLSLKKNPNYFGGAAKLDEVVFTPVSEEVVLQTLAAGKADLGTVYPDVGVVEQVEQEKNLAYTLTPNPGITAIVLNNSVERLSDPLVRRALACALPREALTAQFYGENAWVINAPILRCWNAKTPDGLDDYAYDLERSAALLAQAGYEKNSEGQLEKDGEVFTLLYSVDPTNPISQAVAGYLSDNLAKLGITVTTENLDFATMIENLFSGKLQAFMMGMELGADANPQSLFHSEGYNNLSFYADADADALMEQLRVESASDKKAQLYARLWKKLNEDLPILFLYERNDLWVYSRALQGLNLQPFANAAERIQNASFSG